MPAVARGRAQIVDASGEALVDEHGDRRRPGPLEGGREGGRIGVRAQVAGRGRSPLDLGDGDQPGAGQRVPEPAHETLPACGVTASPSRPRG